MFIVKGRKRAKKIQMHYHISERGNKVGKIHPTKSYHHNEKANSYHKKGLTTEI